MANDDPGMPRRDRLISPQHATELVQRHLNPLLNVEEVRRYEAAQAGGGGAAFEFVLDREPGSILAICRSAGDACVLRAQADRLRYYRAHTHFAVPEPLALVDSDPAYAGPVLLLEKIGGTPLAEARLDARGQAVIEAELARALAELHTHQGERFGPAIDDGRQEQSENWVDVFGPAAKQTIESARRLLPSSCRAVLDDVADYLGPWLTREVRPTLIHGDLLPGNILLDDARPSEPRLLGLLGAQAFYADPEIELARLQLLGIAGHGFFEVYGRTHPIDAGYVGRSRVYWLVTLLEDLLAHGERSLPRCVQVIDELRRLAR